MIKEILELITVILWTVLMILFVFWVIEETGITTYGHLGMLLITSLLVWIGGFLGITFLFERENNKKEEKKK